MSDWFTLNPWTIQKRIWSRPDRVLMWPQLLSPRLGDYTDRAAIAAGSVILTPFRVARAARGVPGLRGLLRARLMVRRMGGRTFIPSRLRR